MESVKVKVDPKIINYIKNKVKYETSSEELETLHKWETGEIIPKFTDIEKMSKKTHIDLGYFFLDEIPEENEILVEFRTKSNNPNKIYLSTDLEETISFMQEIQDWMSEYQENEYGEKLDFINSIKITDNVQEVAKNIRNLLDIQEDWFTQFKNKKDLIKELRNKYAANHILTMFNGIVKENNYRNLDLDEFRAFALLDDYAPLIFINNNDSDSAKIFSLLHEFVHLLLGSNDLLIDNDLEKIENIDKNNQIEFFCNEVAAEVLMPFEEFNKQWTLNKSNKLKKIKNLASYFNTSNLATLVRAYKLNLVNYNEFTQIKRKLYPENKVKNKKNGGNYWNTKVFRFDDRFLKAIINSVKNGKTQITEATRLTNTNIRSFQKLIETVGE